MITLNIKNGDGSDYWTEYFNSQEECDAYLVREQARSDWQKDRAHEAIDNTPPPPSKEEIAAAAQQIKDKKDRIEALKGMKGKNLSNAELQVAIQALLSELLGG